MAGRGQVRSKKPGWLSCMQWCCLCIWSVPVALVAIVLGCKERAALREGRNIEVPSSFLGKTVVVTGASSGIGFATAIHLLKLGAHVIVHGPNEERTRKAARDAHVAAGGLGKATPMVARLDDFDAVRAMANRLKAMVPQVHVLILNAATTYGAAPIFGPAQRKRLMAMNESDYIGKSGKDRVLSTNHFGHFVLTMALRPKWASDLRVVVVTGNGMWQGDWRRILYPGRYPWQKRKSLSYLAYEDSKLANVCFGRALQARLGPEQRAVVHDPGQIQTGMTLDRQSAYYTTRQYLFNKDSRWVWWHMSPMQAAERMVRAAFVTREPPPDVVYSYWMPEELWRHRANARYLLHNDYWRRLYPVKFLMHQMWTFGPLYASIGPGCEDKVFMDYFWNFTKNATGYSEHVDQKRFDAYYRQYLKHAIDRM